MKVTIKEVAMQANVSPSTVSRVLHDSPKISDETKRRVVEAMERLHYHPSPVARSLAGKTTKTIGLVLPNGPDDLFLNTFFIRAMRGISIYAQEHGYFIMYAFSQSEDIEIEFIKNYIDSTWVDGVILATTRQDDRCIAYLRSRGFPFVAIGRPEETRDTYWVDNDNFQAMYNVVNYLVEQGYKRIAFLGGPLGYNVTRNRLAGYRQALVNRGLEVDEHLIAEGASFTEESGYEAMMRILAEATPDAVSATDDLLAFGGLKACDEKGVEVAAVGFNNTVRGAYQTPTLTTVDINPDELGSRACELLIGVLEGEDLPTNHFIVETHLVERDSTRSRAVAQVDPRLT